MRDGAPTGATAWRAGGGTGKRQGTPGKGKRRPRRRQVGDRAAAADAKKPGAHPRKWVGEKDGVNSRAERREERSAKDEPSRAGQTDGQGQRREWEYKAHRQEGEGQFAGDGETASGKQHVTRRTKLQTEREGERAEGGVTGQPTSAEGERQRACDKGPTIATTGRPPAARKQCAGWEAGGDGKRGRGG